MGEIEARGHRVLYVDTVADFGFVTEVVANIRDSSATRAGGARLRVGRHRSCPHPARDSYRP
jgi:hypothetical protein